MPPRRKTGAIKWEGFDEAILGAAVRCGEPPLVVYGYDEMVKVLMDRDGTSLEDAEEYLDHHCVGVWVGDGTPVILMRMNAEEVEEAKEWFHDDVLPEMEEIEDENEEEITPHF